ncbi:MAG: DNA mismatch repair protein MutS [Pseudomonadota bacterium]
MPDTSENAISAIPADATPMMAQYLEIKRSYPDAILFYRMGDFYEMFFDDAVRAAETLSIALTKRGKHLGEDIAMCGVPVHSHENYLERLIRHGYKVAVCEQVEDPAEAKKRGAKSVVKREVIRLVTPGTLTEDTLLPARAHNYLASLARVASGTAIGLAWVDVSTGDFGVTTVEPLGLGAELARLDPGEIILSDSLLTDETLGHLFDAHRNALSALPALRFDSSIGERRLKDHLGVGALEGLGTFSKIEIAAMGALLDYVEVTQVGRMPALARPQRVGTDRSMQIDAATRANLELVKTMKGETKGSLLDVIDRTVTGAGARELGTRLAAPLTDPRAINARLDAVEWGLEARPLRAELRQILKAAPDMARALSRLSLQRGGPRDLAAIRDGLAAAHELAAHLSAVPQSLLPLPQIVTDIYAALRGAAPQLRACLTDMLSENLPLLARDGGFIARDVSAPLDEHRMLRDDARHLIAGLQTKYVDDTGVASLKVRHNNVLGFYIEVGPKNADPLMKSDIYIHRQTLANAVRFTTAELASLASRIADAAAQVLAQELALFDGMVAETLSHADAIARAASSLGELDATLALSELAAECRYTRPRVDDSLSFEIIGGRHPVVEVALLRDHAATAFVPNDCNLTDKNLWLLTGPNMAGKSTFLRQNALIGILAQTGSFVPAEAAHIGTVDRLFSRVGAADDLARGRSTFMVEMVETAAILNQAGPRALVILDEIGRGTATFDGLSIAWAAVEHLHEVNKSRALFATHYHELTALSEKLARLTNATMRVKEWEGDVVFLHEVAAGAADRSYGIQVAKLAGLPPSVIVRAQMVLTALEKGSEGRKTTTLIDDLPLFSASAKTANPQKESLVEVELKKINPDELTPKEALDALYRLKSL